MFGHSNAAIIEVEAETVALLACLVRALRPRYAIETGCYHGTTSRAIGEALTIGHLDTMDTDPYSVEIATKATANLPVTVHHCASLDFVPDRPIEFAFLDSDVGDMRERELHHFLPYMAENAIVAVHDARDLVIRHPLGWRCVTLPIPRGLLLLQEDL